MKINWIISSLECKTLENGLPKVVSRIQWRCEASTTHEGKEYITELYGPADMPSPDPNNFTPYENLTKEQVVQWLTDTMGEYVVQEIYNRLQNNLNELISPTIVYLNPPFEN